MARDREDVVVPPKTWTELTDTDATADFTWVVKKGEGMHVQGMPSATPPTIVGNDIPGIPYERGQGESRPISELFGSSAVRLLAYSELGCVVFTNG